MSRATRACSTAQGRGGRPAASAPMRRCRGGRGGKGCPRDVQAHQGGVDAHGTVGGGLWRPESETGVLDGGGEESVGVGNFRASRDDSAGGVGDINPIYPREGQNIQGIQPAASRRIPPSGSSLFVRLEQPVFTYRPVRTTGSGPRSPCRALPLQCNDGLAPADSKP